MNITLHQLKVLKAVKMNGSITTAAHALHITQPAVSNILKQLESNLGCALTETIGKKIFLTEAGKRAVETAENIEELLEGTTADINALHGKISGKINVAIVSTAKYFVPKLLGEFRKSYPEITITLTVCNRQEAIQILKDNTSDFLIMSQPPQGMTIDKKLFYKDELVIVASPEMELKQDTKKLSDLDNHDWIIREPGSGTRIVMKKLFKQHKMLPNIVMEVGDNESIKQLIMANMGISIVSKQSIELELQHQLIKILQIENFPHNHCWYLIRNKGKHINRPVREFFDFVNDKMSHCL